MFNDLDVIDVAYKYKPCFQSEDRRWWSLDFGDFENLFNASSTDLSGRQWALSGYPQKKKDGTIKWLILCQDKKWRECLNESELIDRHRPSSDPRWRIWFSFCIPEQCFCKYCTPVIKLANIISLKMNVYTYSLELDSSISDQSNMDNIAFRLIPCYQTEDGKWWSLNIDDMKYSYSINSIDLSGRLWSLSIIPVKKRRNTKWFILYENNKWQEYVAGDEGDPSERHSPGENPRWLSRCSPPQCFCKYCNPCVNIDDKLICMDKKFKTIIPKFKWTKYEKRSYLDTSNDRIISREE